MKVRVALTGFGNVGQGLATLLAEHGAEYQQRYGVQLLLSGVADRGGATVNREGLHPLRLLEIKAREGSVAASLGGVAGLGGSDFLQRAEPNILVEASSTNFEDAEPGWSYVRAALHQGADVVLASKGCLALYWDEMFNQATSLGLHVLFSATVGSPVPSLDIAERSLVGTDIRSFEGILNGTTHQILTAMGDGLTYDEGVRQAQAIGIAETDPSLDVDGWDAAAKAAILANAVFGARLRIGDVDRRGIRQVTSDDLERAALVGESIKLIARVVREDGKVRATVAPERRSLRDALGRLTGDAMGIVFQAEPLGKISAAAELGGHGGGISTAMTVLRDVLNLSRDRGWTASDLA